MGAKLHLIVCQYYLREAEAVIRAANLTDVTVAAYPDLCVHPQADRMAAVAQMFGGAAEEGRTVVLVGGCFLLRSGGHGLTEDASHRIFRQDLCFHMFMDKELVDHHLRSGAYLVTPGWLDQWRQQIAAWEFDQPTARAFFAEAANRFILLDTGTDPLAPEKLAACADFLGLPREVLPVGLDHFRLVLLSIVQEWRTEVARQETAAAIGAANRKLADYTMAMDLLVKLTRIMTEDEAIRGMQELFTMLFGATSVRYTAAAADKPPAGPPPSPGHDEAGRLPDGMAGLGEGEDYAASDRGFCVRIVHQRKTLGLLSVEIPGFLERRDEYLNMALNIVNLCGLAVANARAVSARDRAEEELRVKSRELARSNADLEQFAYVVSHDLQTPLRRIILYGEMLREDAGAGLNEAAREHLGSMQNSAERMQQLIEGLLSYSRVSTRTNPFTAVSLPAVARQALDDLAPRIAETGARVEIDALPTVQADALQMYQLLQNLIGNALKFVAKGCGPRVRVSSRSVSAGVVEVSVADNGIGFDEKDLERILKPFQRLHTQDEYPGSGIGLAVCQRIVQRHGGTLTAHSRPGQGATFVFTLPVAAQDGPA